MIVNLDRRLVNVTFTADQNCCVWNRHCGEDLSSKYLIKISQLQKNRSDLYTQESGSSLVKENVNEFKKVFTSLDRQG